VHSWIYDSVLLKPDRASRSSWILIDGTADVKDLVWRQYKDLSTVPLLDAWRSVLLAVTWDLVVTEMSESSYPPVGRLGAVKVNLPEEFPEIVSGLVRRGSLRLE
jgi:hypothetical protein